MRLTRSRQRSSGHGAVAVLTLDLRAEQALVSRYSPELMALIADLPAALRQAALASGYSRAAADEPAAHRSPGLRGCRAADRGITAIIFGHMARRRVRRTGERGFAGARPAVVLGWLTVLIAAVTAGLAA